jgi:hypothetical protein
LDSRPSRSLYLGLDLKNIGVQIYSSLQDARPEEVAISLRISEIYASSKYSKMEEPANSLTNCVIQKEGQCHSWSLNEAVMLFKIGWVF